MEKAFSYVRVSGNSQIDKNGFDRQEKTIANYAGKNKIKIVDTFKDCSTGTTDDRPAFQTMIASILSNGIDIIIIERLDRLAREYRIQEQLLIYLASKNINLISADTGENVTAVIHDDPMKKALIQIQGVFSELDKSMLVKKLQKGREQKKQLTGQCEGRYNLKEKNPELLTEIRRLRRLPKYGRKLRMTYKDIATELNRQGYITAFGGKFSGNTISQILLRAKSYKRRVNR